LCSNTLTETETRKQQLK